MAWLYVYKPSQFDIKYGGWLLLHTDEHVPYNAILSSHHGMRAALIGIAGFTYNSLMLAISLLCMTRESILNNVLTHKFFYWFAVFNLFPVFSYVPNLVFSSQGDIGRFVSGMQISPWIIFIPGTIIVLCLLKYVLNNCRQRLAGSLNIMNIWTKRTYLWFSIFVIFFMIYTHGYNPFSDVGALPITKWIAATSILMGVCLLYILDPKRDKTTANA